jgi:ATPase subunit of ABC transporter with duplicated ATPase domains
MDAVKKWNGGVILISHDERFITTVANEVCTFPVHKVQEDLIINVVVGLR